MIQKDKGESRDLGRYVKYAVLRAHVTLPDIPVRQIRLSSLIGLT